MVSYCMLHKWSNIEMLVLFLLSFSNVNSLTLRDANRCYRSASGQDDVMLATIYTARVPPPEYLSVSYDDKIYDLISSNRRCETTFRVSSPERSAGKRELNVVMRFHRDTHPFDFMKMSFPHQEVDSVHGVSGLIHGMTFLFMVLGGSSTLQPTPDPVAQAVCPGYFHPTRGQKICTVIAGMGALSDINLDVVEEEIMMPRVFNGKSVMVPANCGGDCEDTSTAVMFSGYVVICPSGLGSSYTPSIVRLLHGELCPECALKMDISSPSGNVHIRTKYARADTDTGKKLIGGQVDLSNVYLQPFSKLHPGTLVDLARTQPLIPPKQFKCHHRGRDFYGFDVVHQDIEIFVGSQLKQTDQSKNTVWVSEPLLYRSESRSLRRVMYWPQSEFKKECRETTQLL